MKNLIISSLFLFVGCATKYVVPGNRFVTPETQGGALRTQVELQQSGANQLIIDTSVGTVDEGVLYEQITRLGFLASASVFNQIDLVWSHTGGSNSLLGVKFQFLGDPRLSKSVGHKAALGVLFGGNEHESEEENIEFELTGKEYLLLYGYRFSPNLFPYASLSLGNYAFNGRITGSVLNGLEPEYVTNSRAISGGLEISFEAFFVKLEGTYQQLITDETDDKESVLFGYSLGYSW